MNYRFAHEICNVPRITEFALKLHINPQSLSHSESSNFSQCVIMDKIDSCIILENDNSELGKSNFL